MKKILFSCVGTSDPVRGEHDGPMLHILRHYRPDIVYIFLTDEIKGHDDKDARFKKVADWIGEHWNGYSPTFHFIYCAEKNVYDLDAMEPPLYAAVDQISAAHPEDALLLNLSSGTPQMKMLLSQMAMDVRYHACGIQVPNFEGSSGHSDRTNHKNYDVDLELEFNEDEAPNAANRCMEPKFYALRREHTRHQVETLLRQRNFEAVAGMTADLPVAVQPLVKHLAARSRLRSGEAQKLAAPLRDKLPFPLYPYKTGPRTAYSSVCEYYLLMKNLALTGHYNEFVLHMEPLTVHLQLALLEKLLRPRGVSLDDFIRRNYFEPDRLKTAAPALYAHYEQCLKANGKYVERKQPNTYICNALLSYFAPLPAKADALFAHYGALKDLRNQLAHSLYALTEEELQNACGIAPAALLREIEGTLAACYDACDPAIFTVYDRCIDWLCNTL